MKKRIKKIITIFVIVLISVIVAIAIIFYFRPSWFLNFYTLHDSCVVAKGTFFSFSREVICTESLKPFDPEWSPNKKYLAFFDDVGESYDKQWFLKIINPRTMKIKTIFIGPWVTSNYEWFDNNTIRVYIGGASGARFYRNLDIRREKPYVYADDRATDDNSEWGAEVYKSDGSFIQIDGG